MHTLSARTIRDRILKGEASAVSITGALLDRIHKHDPKIGAFLRVSADKAMEQALRIDQKRARGEKLGKLAGVPIAIKDNIHIKGQLTTCASKFLTNYRAPFDSTVAKLLEAEDAIFIGKTNLDEFAMGSSTENSALQKTRNPWNLNCTPGGSSGGSAAAVAARFCPLALGSDTGGSIRLPASFCGVVGFKPTYGRVSRYGLVAFGSSLDQIGPFATTTADIALAMEVIGLPCENDSTSIPMAGESYLEHLDGNIRGMRIGVPSSFLSDLKPEARANFENALDVIKGLGATVVDVSLETLSHSIAVYYILATAEAATNLARFDGIRYGQRSTRAQSLQDVYTLSKEEGFGSEVKRRILLGTYVLSAGYQDAYYKQAQKVRQIIINEYNQAFAKCDIVAMPVSPFPAFEIGAIKDPLEMYLADIYSISANLAGLPAISVPSGFSQGGKPIGLQLIGPQLKDVRVCKVADAYEQATGHNKVLPVLE